MGFDSLHPINTSLIQCVVIWSLILHALSTDRSLFYLYWDTLSNCGTPTSIRIKAVKIPPARSLTHSHCAHNTCCLTTFLWLISARPTWALSLLCLQREFSEFTRVSHLLQLLSSLFFLFYCPFEGIQFSVQSLYAYIISEDFSLCKHFFRYIG